MEVVIYGRDGCHLCDLLHEEVEAIARGRVRVSVVDVDASPELASRYGDRVPVLCCAGEEICQYQLDTGSAPRLETFLRLT